MSFPPLPTPSLPTPTERPSNGFDDDPDTPTHSRGADGGPPPIIEDEDEPNNPLGAEGNAYAPPTNSLADDFTPGEDEKPSASDFPDPRTTGKPADDRESFSVVGWLMSHTLVAALLVAACMGVVVYAVFFRSTDSNGFDPLQNDEGDAERGEASKSGSGGSFNAGAGPFASLQSSSSNTSSSGDTSLNDLDTEQQYHLTLLKHSDTSSSGAVHFLEDVLTRLGIPSYGQSSFTAKLKDDYLSTIQQLSQLDNSDWKRLNFPVVIEEAVRKALEDRKRLMQEGGEGGGRTSQGGKGKGGGLSLKAAAPKKGEKKGEKETKETEKRASGGSIGGSAEKKAVKKPLVSEAAEADDENAEEEGWADMDF